MFLEAALHSGEDVVIPEADGVHQLARIVKVKTDGKLVLWRYGMPGGERPSLPGFFGFCQVVDPIKHSVVRLESVVDDSCLGLGSMCVAWMGECHIQGVIVATRGHEKLVQFRSRYVPTWYEARELQTGNEAAHQGGISQCALCGNRSTGKFNQDGYFCCTRCTVA